MGYMSRGMDRTLIITPLHRLSLCCSLFWFSHFNIFFFYSGNNWQFSFNVKFYPPDPSLLTEDITRYTQRHTDVYWRVRLWIHSFIHECRLNAAGMMLLGGRLCRMDGLSNVCSIAEGCSRTCFCIDKCHQVTGTTQQSWREVLVI